MLINQPSNLLEIDCLIEQFLQDHATGIKTIHQIYCKNSDKLSLQALMPELMEELRTGCVTFFNKKYPTEELNSYLFYIVNTLCKRHAEPIIKKISHYICPGCSSLGKEIIINCVGNIFKCYECENTITNDPKKNILHQTFACHKKSGSRCLDCKRFIPDSLDGSSTTIICPYLDCCFVGSWDSLKKMNHPSIKVNRELTITPDIIENNFGQQVNDLDFKEKLNCDYEIVSEVIETQKNSVPYNSFDITIKHKTLVYIAFENLLKKYPEEMIGYLLGDQNGYAGFQHKIFQEYIKLLEETLPFSFKKNNRLYQIRSLLDDNLNLFDGISVFESVVSNNKTIKNKTSELYIGGRKGAITKPFYIGKLLNLIDKNTKEIYLEKVVEYTFSRIKVDDIAPNTEVIVTHLRVPPHYQMGGMVYVNRIRKKISDRAKFLIKNNQT